MDDYGIGASALAGLTVYEAASRQSGRTIRMLSGLKGGETIVCERQEEAAWLKNVTRETPERANITVIVASGMEDRRIRGPGPYIFTEAFVWREYERCLKGLAREFEARGAIQWRLEFPGDKPPPAIFQRRSSRGDLK